MTLINDTGMFFDVSIDVQHHLLRIRYTLTNQSGEDLGMFNRIMTVNPDGTSSFSPYNVYIDVEGSVLHVKKLVLPVPAGLQMAERPQPFITVLKNTQTFSEEILLSTPVAASNPLKVAVMTFAEKESEIAAARQVTITAVMFSLGVFRIQPDWKLFPVSPGNPSIVRVWPPGPAVDSQLVLTRQTALSQPVSALDYMARPWKKP